MTAEIDSWLTAVRLRRLPEALVAIRTHPPPGVPEQRVNRVVWNRCDGPLDDVQRLIDVLAGAGLLERRGSLTLKHPGAGAGPGEPLHTTPEICTQTLARQRGATPGCQLCFQGPDFDVPSGRLPVGHSPSRWSKGRKVQTGLPPAQRHPQPQATAEPGYRRRCAEFGQCPGANIQARNLRRIVESRTR